jgi:hypothetical protein
VTVFIRKSISSLVFVVVILCGTQVSADYIATGPIKGFFCTGFVIEACSQKEVNRVEQGGQLFEVKRVYKDVDEYKSNLEYCHIRVKGNSAWSFLSDTPVFFYFEEELGTPDSIGFPCVKR